MAIIAGLVRMTGSLAKAFLKPGRKNKTDNRLITDAYNESTDKGYTGTRAKFVEEGEKIAKQRQKRKTGNVPDSSQNQTGSKKLPEIKDETKKEKRIRRQRITKLRREQWLDDQAQRRGGIGPIESAPTGGRQRIDIPVKGSSRRLRRVAHPQNPLRSSEEYGPEHTDNWTYDEYQEYLSRGLGGSAYTNWLQMTGKVASPQTVEEFEDMVRAGILRKQKYGGVVKRKHSGKTKPSKSKRKIRGCGAAKKGFGKANYSNKLY